MDSGNSYRTAISGSTWRSLPLSLQPINPFNNRSLHTACSKGSLQVQGELLQPIPMTFGPHTVYVKPVVIETLHTPVNVSGPLLEGLKWSLDLPRRRIFDHLGHSIVLHSPSTSTKDTSKKWAIAHVAQDVTVPAWSRAILLMGNTSWWNTSVMMGSTIVSMHTSLSPRPRSVNRYAQAPLSESWATQGLV